MKALVVGHGSIGSRHVRLLRERADIAEVAVVSRREAGGLQRYPSLEEVADLPSFGYIVVASETHLHDAHLRLLEERVAGRTILLEKPFCLDARAGAWRDHRFANLVRVGYNLRFHATVRCLRETLGDEPALAAFLHMGNDLRAWRPGRDPAAVYSASAARGGGVLLDLSHELDLAAWLFGGLAGAAGACAQVGGLGDAEDCAAILARSGRGTRVSVTLESLSRHPVRRMLVHTPSRTLEADLVSGRLLESRSGGGRTEVLAPEADRDESYRLQHERMLGAGGAGVCTPAEALGLLEVVAAVRAGAAWRT